MNSLKRIILGEDYRATIRRAIILGIIALLVSRYVILPVRAGGSSMEPTVRDGTWHAANLLKYIGREPQRGDVVLISMAGMKALYLKRILGLPGETVSFLDGQLFINGLPQPEPYLAEHGNWRMPAVTVGTDTYFVAGDNRKVTLEEHTYGLVDRAKIKGGLWF